MYSQVSFTVLTGTIYCFNNAKYSIVATVLSSYKNTWFCVDSQFNNKLCDVLPLLSKEVR